MKDFFQKFQDLKPVPQDSLDDMLSKGIVKIAWIHPPKEEKNSDNVINHLKAKSGIYEVCFYDKHPVSNGEGDLTFQEFQSLYNIIIDPISTNVFSINLETMLSDEVEEEDLGEDVKYNGERVSVKIHGTGNLKDYLKYAIKDLRIGDKRYIELKDNFVSIAELAQENRDNRRFQTFFKVAKREAKMQKEDVGERYAILAELILKTGKKSSILEHYKFILRMAAEEHRNLSNLSFGERAELLDADLALEDHITLFEDYNRELKISKYDFDISNLRRLTEY